MKQNKLNIIPAILLFFITLFIFLLIATKKDPHSLSSSTLGENYPYSVENIKIMCASDYPNAVYIIDKNNNKYAINGNADVYFTKIKPDNKYKGFTTSILKKGKTDADFLQIGLKICRNEND